MKETELQEVLKFWFGPDPNNLFNQELWFKLSPKTDFVITQKFSSLLNLIERIEIDNFLNDEKNLLAILIVLHQFTRFIRRGHSEMFGNDSKALTVAKILIGCDKKMLYLSHIEKYFVYLALLDSEKILRKLK